MELDHEFTVPVPVDRAWSVLLDLERVAPCVPGASLDSIEGDRFTGRLKVKLGAMTITYKGTAQLVVTDESAHIVTIEGSAKEARGTGTASATVQAQLHGEGDDTRVTVHTKLNITGRPAQFGRGILAEVGGKLITRFAKALSEELQVPDEDRRSPAAAPQAPSGQIPEAPISEAQAPEAQTPEAQTSGTESPAASAPPQTQAAEPQAETPEPQAEAAEPQAPGTEPKISDAEPKTPPAQAPAVQPAVQPQGPSVEPQAERENRPPLVDLGRSAQGPTGPELDGQVPVTPRPVRHSEEAIDLLEVAGPSVVKRAAPVFGGIVALLTVRYLFRRRRGRHHR